MEIRYKSQFYKLWKAGVLGNRTLLTDNLEEALGWRSAKIGFREAGKTGGGAWELADRADAPLVYAKWKSLGRVFLMDGAVPNNKTTVQGEVTRTDQGLVSFLAVRSELLRQFYNTVYAWSTYSIPDDSRLEPIINLFKNTGLPPMRVTMANDWHHHRSYLQTRLILQELMDPSSRDDLDTLLEMYPDSAIEFSCFEVNTGMFPRRNTIFWEVRNY
jgi:hypothetical protein